MGVEVELTSSDAGEVMVLQRAAFASEAQLYGDPFLPALTQTLAELEKELVSNALGIRIAGRLVGAVRWATRGSTEDGLTTEIRRLIVAPDMQGKGIGTRLLRAAQVTSGARHFEIFTGSRSEGNIRLYERDGFVIARHEPVSPEVTLVFMTK